MSDLRKIKWETSQLPWKQSRQPSTAAEQVEKQREKNTSCGALRLRKACRAPETVQEAPTILPRGAVGRAAARGAKPLSGARTWLSCACADAGSGLTRVAAACWILRWRSWASSLTFMTTSMPLTVSAWRARTSSPRSRTCPWITAHMQPASQDSAWCGQKPWPSTWRSSGPCRRRRRDAWLWSLASPPKLCATCG